MGKPKLAQVCTRSGLWDSHVLGHLDTTGSHRRAERKVGACGQALPWDQEKKGSSSLYHTTGSVLSLAGTGLLAVVARSAERPSMGD